jgi:uncharacterized protein YdaU (DUF1376 family)
VSERPFMQLYVSDFIGDTLHLSTEQVGAYLLLLMAMWNAGGSLPDDEAKLARIVRMSIKRWRAVASDLMAFFEVGGGAVRHNRLTKELQKSEGKSQSRASAGAAGGRAKALKEQEARLANASRMPQHLPDTRNQNRQEPRAQQKEAARAPDVTDRLLEAAGIRGNTNQSLAFPGPILALVEAGLSLELDVIPALKAKPNPKARTWSYFVPQIEEFAANRRGVQQRIGALPPDPQTALANWPVEKWRLMVDYWRETGNWNTDALGPRPDQPGCRAPAELLARAA